jgi:hypothetical protein
MSIRCPTHRRPPAVSAGAVGILLLISASASQAADVPKLAEIQARLEKQRAAVKSLFVELHDYTTITVEPAVLLSWPEFKDMIGLIDERQEFACKGPKRYALNARLKPIKLLRPRKGNFGNPDMSRGDNGRVSWGRPLEDKVQRARVFTLSIFRTRPDRQWVQTPGYFENLGWQDTDPQTQDKFVLGKRKNDLVEMLKHHELKVASQPATLDGANCVVLEGDTARTFTLPSGPKTFKSHHTIWLDLDHGLAVRQLEHRTDGGFSRVVNSDFVEIQPGLWFPKKSALERFAPPDAAKEDQGHPVWIWHSELIRWQINSFPDDLFDPVTKPGDRVNDQRSQARE